MSVKELKVTDLTKTYGEKTLFDHLSFLIHEKDRIGLIGINGTGKTSLLNIIAGVILLQFSSQVIIKLGTFPRIKHLTRILRLQKPCFRETARS